MSSTNTENLISEKLAQAIADRCFPEVDNLLRSGRHIGNDDLDHYAFLSEFERPLQQFYSRYQAELVRAPENFFYLRPRSTSILHRSVLSELDMLVGKVLCFLYLSPERLAQEGLFTAQELFDELVTLADKSKLLRLVNLRASGSDLDHEKLFDKVKTSLRRLRKLGMLTPIGDSGKFCINQTCFRFGADVRTNDDPRQAQLRLIRDGEIVLHPEPPTQGSLFNETDTPSNKSAELGETTPSAASQYNEELL
ncbi:MAG: chromosome partition protein MukE [Vibrionaceae bacterium]